jgi:hypothetical protein
MDVKNSNSGFNHFRIDSLFGELNNIEFFDKNTPLLKKSLTTSL